MLRRAVTFPAWRKQLDDTSAEPCYRPPNSTFAGDILEAIAYLWRGEETQRWLSTTHHGMQYIVLVQSLPMRDLAGHRGGRKGYCVKMRPHAAPEGPRMIAHVMTLSGALPRRQTLWMLQTWPPRSVGPVNDANEYEWPGAWTAGDPEAGEAPGQAPGGEPCGPAELWNAWLMPKPRGGALAKRPALVRPPMTGKPGTQTHLLQRPEEKPRDEADGSRAAFVVKLSSEVKAELHAALGTGARRFATQACHAFCVLVLGQSPPPETGAMSRLVGREICTTRRCCRRTRWFPPVVAVVGLC